MRGLVRIGMAAVLGFLILGGAGGCLVEHNLHETRSGHWVPENTFDQIEPGKTSSAWVTATLGQPSEKSRIDEHSEIWKWTYSKTKTANGYVFLIFKGSDTTETPGVAFVEFKDGVVVRKWRN